MYDVKKLIDVREDYVKKIRAELLGPGSEFSTPDPEHELISSGPLGRYTMGVLYPQDVVLGFDNDDTVQESEETEELIIDETPETYLGDIVNKGPREADENMDEEVGLSAQHKPSSIGITFMAKGDVDSVTTTISFATYRSARADDCVVPFAPADPTAFSIPSQISDVLSYDPKSGLLKLAPDFTREKIERVKITLSDNNKELLNAAYRLLSLYLNGYVRMPRSFDLKIDFPNEKDYLKKNVPTDGIEASVSALRKKIDDDVWSVTIMLVNEGHSDKERHEDCLFQSKIEISSEKNRFVIVENDSNTDPSSLDEEEHSLELLYREKKTYGTGLGVSVDWTVDERGGVSLWSEYMPEYEIPPMSFNLPADMVAEGKLSMKFLSDLNRSDKAEKISGLTDLVDSYEKWICGLEKTAASLNKRYKSAASKNIEECKTACKRMRSGIETLRMNEKAYDAFVLANRAMFMQRVHLKFQGNAKGIDRYSGDEDVSEFLSNIDYNEADDKHIWRPFQIAFLLMDINSIVYDDSEERDLVDLIWFPTGGGKTEAYLGLTAFTIFYRRLAYPKRSSGTTVIMRYTLRLLTAQQFNRAATLICACEHIRRDYDNRRTNYPKYVLGNDPINIGLWIGREHIPNKIIEAKKHLDDFKKTNDAKHNKFHVLKCPWCGTRLTPAGKGEGSAGKLYGYMCDGRKFSIRCTHDDCTFADELPVQVIDEELYASPPTLLFGTVDKFASLPWNGDIGAFFDKDSKGRPPELIIQDELHLISGTLGTIVGLYETSVDAICKRGNVSPKIVASTATIRRAREQCSVLYNRDVVQFPAPGLDSDDSFFAKEIEISHENGVFGRKYVGIMPSGKTKAMMEIRAMAAMLQKSYEIEGLDEEKDKYWTLTVYFNSLRDLGKASTLVDDDVKDFIKRMSYRMMRRPRNLVGADELTSRINTTHLNNTLDKLEKREYSQENINNGIYASDVLIATNMISVGIDIARLNIMLMVGQPKLTGEYIQASSRIGREYPGVAFVQYDSTKSRDRSHYERFTSYHDSFYRYVEPTSATPFSDPARTRALHAVLVSILRNRAHLDDDYSAGEFDKKLHADDIRFCKEFVVDRAAKMNMRIERGAKIDLKELESEVDRFFDRWHLLAKRLNGDTPFCFGRKYMMTTPEKGGMRLLKQFNKDEFDDDATETLTSMRNVDTVVLGEMISKWRRNHER